jgi:hypothetical protein
LDKITVGSDSCEKDKVEAKDTPLDMAQTARIKVISFHNKTPPIQNPSFGGNLAAF